MAINGAATIINGLGGAVSAFGPELGDYHIVVNEIAVSESKNSKRPSLELELFVKDDPNHAAREGKKLMRVFIALPFPGTDDDEKLKVMKGMVKRRWFDGLGIKWPEEGTAFDARKFQGKAGWVRVANGKDKDGQPRPEVVAVALTAQGLGTPKAGKSETVDTGKGGARARR